MIFSTTLLIIDIISKQFATELLRFSDPLVLIPGWLQLVYVENRGAAFGILFNSRWLLTGISLLASLGLLYLYFAKKYQNNWQKLGIQFVLAGAVGNLIDRVFLGHVVDFIDLPYWPTFNFADIFINVGVFFFILDMIRENKKANK